ncbi:MAG: hemolysin [Hyphomicrobiales bacterium]|nr:hemolysin [Hyphomicrobiales bacterium]
MTERDTSTNPEPEPGSSTASAASRGPTLWNRLRAMLALRTVSLRDDLEVALESEGSAETADFTGPERIILQNVLKLGEMRIDDVMVPRADIVAIEASETLGDLIAQFREAGHSRLPVYEDNLDNITGFVHVKDALRRITEPVKMGDSENGENHHVPVKLLSPALRSKIGKLDIVRTVIFVPPSMPVGDLLQQMQQKRVHMAIVIDEYGGTDGVVTIEDLLEAVVGEIEDEHDELETALVRKVNSNIFIASARAELPEVQAVVGPDFNPGDRADEVDTLGGLVFDLAGHVPAPGEIVTGLKGFEFEVLQSDGRQIKKLKIKRVLRTARPRKVSAANKAGEEQTAAE